MTEMERTITRNLLQDQVGYQLFCPRCQDILDVRSAVSLDVYNGEQLAATKAFCSKCYDKHKDGITARLEAKGLTVKATDGRTLFAKQVRNR